MEHSHNAGMWATGAAGGTRRPSEEFRVESRNGGAFGVLRAVRSDVSVDVPAAERSPRTLGRHRVLAKLGQGGMADVYLTAVQGQHDVTKLLVAKVLRGELAADAEYRAMFVREARVATLLQHRNLVQTLEVDESDGHQYITMEYLDGRPLHTALATLGRDAMPLDIHVAILALTLAGLHAAHEQRDLSGEPLDVVHRDVSPQNVFVTYDGEVKVVDFGVAKVRGVGTVSETGALIGKIGYMAPEQALSEVIDRRADVFSVGIMLWEALARRPFVDRGEGEAAALRKRLNGEILSPRAVAPAAPEELLAHCERAISFAPGDRFATAAAFEEALNAYLERHGARVGSKEIAGVIAPHFVKERAHVRTLIEERLAALGRDSGGSLPSLHDGASRGDLSPGIAVDRRPDGPGRRVVGGLLAAALGLAVVVGGLLSRPPHDPAETAPKAQPRPLTPGVDVSQPLPEVRLRVHVTPVGALLALDGNSLGPSPFSGAVPRDFAPHVLEATEPGYVTLTRPLPLDSDLDVELALVPTPSPHGSTAAPTTRAVAPTPSSTRRPSRPVDDRDPYAP